MAKVPTDERLLAEIYNPPHQSAPPSPHASPPTA